MALADTQPPQGETTGTAPDFDVTAFNLLSTERRWLAIRYLAMQPVGETVTLRRLARMVAAVENDTAPAAVGSKAYKSTYNALLQSHMPKFTAADAVEYDEARKVVTVTETTHRLAALAQSGEGVLSE